MAEEEKKVKQVQANTQQLIQAEVQAAMKGVLAQINQKLAGNQLADLADAYIKAVASSRDAHKNAQNPHLRNQYADLGSVLESVRESFLSNGLWLMQSPGTIEVK